MLFHQLDDVVERSVAALYERRGIALEADSLAEFAQVFLLVHGAADRVYLDAGERVRALVDCVGDAVLVGIENAARAIDNGIGGRVGALVLGIGHAVLVRVEGAARAIDRNAARRVGAFVESVIDAVLVGIFRASGAIDDCALWRIGALVHGVLDAVFVRVEDRCADLRRVDFQCIVLDDCDRVGLERTAKAIDRGSLWRVGALVEVVRNSVAVFVCRAAVRIDGYVFRRMRAKVFRIFDPVAVLVVFRKRVSAPGEKGGHSVVGGSRLVGDDISVLLFVYRHEFSRQVVFVDERGDADVRADGEIDSVSEMEPDARGESHRVDKRISPVESLFHGSLRKIRGRSPSIRER